ncbi:FAD-binding oxidoreductase [Micromonospora sp. NBC_01813]|uniref:FAD-binding oxidoreductase n=1 Tax=Micromonospora sp. NBC_01813 TaxID=2975988 RepID=UPI002DDA7414|nr:BBE domain-containing protein [Micromonospora sp. NBC_01813]WSA07206.1 FAD-binding protein [Micromonospora sp. NBC_01813]
MFLLPGRNALFRGHRDSPWHIDTQVGKTMSGSTRRGFIAGTAALGGAALIGSPATAEVTSKEGARESAVILPGDARYEDLVLRRTSERFFPRPELFRLPTTTEQVLRAVDGAVRAGKRVTVRSGGHCYENFVGDGAEVIIDLSAMRQVTFDRHRNAFMIEPGASLWTVFERLYLGWGVTIPGGQCGGVAAGGHIQGGGYGALSRQFGSVVDYLYAVEVVVVDRSGRARVVVATREPGDKNRDLWWAHTGGGGGNFGVVTRYWMRTPGAPGNDPARLLPKPPAETLGATIVWSWHDVTEESFHRLLRNYGEWHERNSAPDSRYTSLFSLLLLARRDNGADPGALAMVTSMDGSPPDADQLLSDYLAEVTDSVPGAITVQPPHRLPWLAGVKAGSLDQAEESGMFKAKAAYLRKRFTDQQIGTAYTYLTSTDHDNERAVLLLVSYGGKVNTVAPDATAMPQRDSIMKAIYTVTWTDPNGEQANLDWIRRWYSAMYQDTGGVPVPNSANDGSYINYPDLDTTDPQWNKSGVPWHTLYYKGNYRKLQQVKVRWDPRDVFHHAMSIKLPPH